MRGADAGAAFDGDADRVQLCDENGRLVDGDGILAGLAPRLLADGKLYITSEEGSVITVRAGRTLEILARSDLGEEFMSTPAISEGTIYFRSRGHPTAVGL